MTTTTGFAPGRWLLDVAASTATVEAHGLFGTRVHGSVPAVSASVDVDPAGTPVAVRAAFDLAAIDTGNKRRDRDLRKPQLLDLDRHPTVTFTADAPVPNGTSWTVDGVVTARGRDIPIRLDITLTAGAVLTVAATGVLDRKPLGMRAPRFMIGRFVRVNVSAVFIAP